MLIMISPNFAPDVTICIPYNKIYNISFDIDSVVVVYDAGEKMEVYDGVFQDKVEKAKVTYENSAKLKKVVEQFYNAVKKRDAVFYFGNMKKKSVDEWLDLKNEVVPEVVTEKKGDENCLLEMLSK